MVAVKSRVLKVCDEAGGVYNQGSDSCNYGDAVCPQVPLSMAPLEFSVVRGAGAGQTARLRPGIGPPPGRCGASGRTSWRATPRQPLAAARISLAQLTRPPCQLHPPSAPPQVTDSLSRPWCVICNKGFAWDTASSMCVVQSCAATQAGASSSGQVRAGAAGPLPPPPLA
jgi:hypothetical protein